MSKILGLDLGTTTLGIAVTDAISIAVHPREVFRFEPGNFKRAREHVLEICRNEGISEIVLGVPYYESGDLSPHAKSCLRFKNDLLIANKDLIIHEIDESYSTIDADEKLKEMNLSYEKRKALVDEYAAVVILERYLRKMEERK